MTRRESAWLIALAILALAPRLAFVTLFPARPYTDFFNLVRFAEAFNETPFAAGHFGWRYFGLGVPLPLSMVLRMTTAPANDVARYATAVLTGLTALLPFVLWRGALSLPARLLASLLLALWPGHVFFSGVVTPDNWILPPSIALAALAVRALARADEGHPVAAALALCAAGAVRPEMFVVLLPLVAAAAGLFRAPRQWAWHRIAAGAAAGALALLLMAGVRWAGSGRFSATTEHSGLAVLGSYAPGGGGWYWTSPQIYFAAVVPQVALHPPEMGRLAPALALHEARRRPTFHLLRCFAGPTKSLLHSDRSALFWSIGFPGALSGPRQKQAQALVARLTPLLEWSTFALLSVCAAGCLLALRRRAWPVLVIAASMALKVLVHAVTVSQTRYFIVVTAFALLVVALIVEEARRRPLGREAAAALAAGLVLVGALRFAAERAEAYIIAADDEQLTYRFTLTDPSRVAWLQCVVRDGRLTALWAAQAAAAVRLLHADPQAGESATAECRAWATRAATLELRLRDPYDAGGFPDRIVQTVTVDGQERLRHDLAAEPGGGWMSAPLGPLAPGQSRAVVLRIAAGRADPGWSWGAVAETEFRLALAAP